MSREKLFQLRTTVCCGGGVISSSDLATIGQVRQEGGHVYVWCVLPCTDELWGRKFDFLFVDPVVAYQHEHQSGANMVYQSDLFGGGYVLKPEFAQEFCPRFVGGRALFGRWAEDKRRNEIFEVNVDSKMVFEVYGDGLTYAEGNTTHICWLLRRDSREEAQFFYRHLPQNASCIFTQVSLQEDGNATEYDLFIMPIGASVDGDGILTSRKRLLDFYTRLKQQQFGARDLQFVGERCDNGAIYDWAWVFNEYGDEVDPYIPPRTKEIDVNRHKLRTWLRLDPGYLCISFKTLRDGSYELEYQCLYSNTLEKHEPSVYHKRRMLLVRKQILEKLKENDIELGIPFSPEKEDSIQYKDAICGEILTKKEILSSLQRRNEE